MRVLYFTPRNFVARNTGACLRDYYLVRALAGIGSVSVLGIGPRPQSTPEIDLPVVRYSIIEKGPSYSISKLFKGFIGPTPITVLNYADPAVAAELKLLLEQSSFDVVQIEGIHLLSYLPIIRSVRPRPRIVCDWHDIESDLMRRYSLYSRNPAMRWYAYRTVELLERVEKRLLMDCDVHLAVSEHEKCKLKQRADHAVVEVVQNGVDATYYSDLDFDSVASFSKTFLGRHRRSVIFVGSMDFHANVDAAQFFAAEVWPLIRAQDPELEFILVGSNPVAQVRRLAKIPGVTVTGTVQDVRPYYRNALVAVVPLRIGGGTRLKILEAMAAGVPVISTALGAEGLALEAGRDILIANSPEEMANLVIRIAHSSVDWNRISRRGSEIVKTRYDWSVVTKPLCGVHQSLLV
jgi:glycosyltransferase involved in cell wall biosynthesis